MAQTFSLSFDILSWKRLWNLFDWFSFLPWGLSRWTAMTTSRNSPRLMTPSPSASYSVKTLLFTARTKKKAKAMMRTWLFVDGVRLQSTVFNLNLGCRRLTYQRNLSGTDPRDSDDTPSTRSFKEKQLKLVFFFASSFFLLPKIIAISVSRHFLVKDFEEFFSFLG